MFGLASEIQTGVLLNALWALCMARLVSLQVRDQICNNIYAIRDFQGIASQRLPCARVQSWDKDVVTYSGGLSPSPQVPRISVYWCETWAKQDLSSICPYLGAAGAHVLTCQGSFSSCCLCQTTGWELQNYHLRNSARIIPASLGFFQCGFYRVEMGQAIA